MKYIIIHGTFGQPKENWFPWLKEELEGRGHDVYVPQMPTPKNQSKENWYKALIEQVPEIDKDTILIGHSSGANFILHVLETLDETISKSIFVGVVMDYIDKQYQEINQLNESFVNYDFDWSKINENAGKVTIFHSDNDPYVPLEKHGEVLSSNIKSEITIIKNAGHFNSAAGYDKFPEILRVLEC